MKRILYKMYDKLIHNKLVNNFIILLTGEGIVSVFGMISMAILIQSIGLEFNGMILSVQAYCLLFNSLFAFKSFQALIKYLAVEIERNNQEKMKEYILQSYFFDIAAIILSVIFGFAFINIYAIYMNWDSEIIFYCKIFMVASLFQVQGTPTGILRAFNKFNFITYNNVINSFLKLILYVFGFIVKAEFTYYIWIEVILYVLPNILLNIFAIKTLKENNINKFYNSKLKITKEFFMFNLYTNITSTIDIPVGNLTAIIINKYLGFSAISIYKVFEKLGSIIGKLGSPLNQIIYPEMALRIAKKDYKGAKRINDKLIVGISLIGVALLVGVTLTYKLWLGIFITNYETYLISLLLYLSYVIFTNATAGIHSLFIALNYVKYNITIVLLVNIVYILVIYNLVIIFQLNGVIIALLLQALAVIIIKVIIMRKNNYLENGFTKK